MNSLENKNGSRKTRAQMTIPFQGPLRYIFNYEGLFLSTEGARFLSFTVLPFLKFSKCEQKIQFA